MFTHFFNPVVQFPGTIIKIRRGSGLTPDWSRLVGRCKIFDK